MLIPKLLEENSLKLFFILNNQNVTLTKSIFIFLDILVSNFVERHNVIFFQAY